MSPRFFSVLFLLVSVMAAQEKYPQNTFQPPLQIPLILAGTFGELRQDHFHAGVDLKTQQREGLSVFAIADGTVRRIKISPWGYGKALYIDHPNGFTSVYAHLQKYSPEIEAYVKKAQYQKQSYEIELFPDPGTLTVTQNSVVGYSGNTGRSFGPHLHFEIRDSATQKPTNPLLYGYNVRDATNPTIASLFGYPLSKDAVINQSAKRIQLHFAPQPDGTLLADKVTAIGTLGFGFEGFDRLDMAANKNGVYSVQQTVNGKVYLAYTFEAFSFRESSYINSFIDYPYYSKVGRRIQKCFKEPYNLLSFYTILYKAGKIEIKEGFSYTVELRIADIAGNATKLVVPVEGKRETPKISAENVVTTDFIVANRPYTFDLGSAHVFFPAHTFYKDFYLDLKKRRDTVTLHNNSVAVHQPFTLSFDASAYTSKERQQLFIAHLDEDGAPKYVPTYKHGDSLTAQTRTLGSYTLVKDSIAPEIIPKNFKKKKWLSYYNYLSLSISDDLSGIDTYQATLNGEWILMEYDPKNHTLTYNFEDKILRKTRCYLSVRVTDRVGNTSVFTSTFFRKW